MQMIRYQIRKKAAYDRRNAKNIARFKAQEAREIERKKHEEEEKRKSGLLPRIYVPREEWEIIEEYSPDSDEESADGSSLGEEWEVATESEPEDDEEWEFIEKQ